LDVSDTGVIHLIDDDKDVLSIVTSALELEGYTVHSFSSSSEALKDIELKCKKKVRMLIADIRMPEHTGFEIARRMRAIKPDVPIIFMTAFEIHPSEFDKVFPKLQVDEFIQKPFRVKKLLEMVHRYP